MYTWGTEKDGHAYLSDEWLRTLDNSSLDPCPAAAEEIRYLRASNDNLRRMLKTMVRGWKYADLTESEFIDAWGACGGIDTLPPTEGGEK
jgi:hypothetical protein